MGPKQVLPLRICGLESNGNEGLFPTPHVSRTVVSPSDTVECY